MSAALGKTLRRWLVLASLGLSAHLAWTAADLGAARRQSAPPGPLMPAPGGALEELAVQFHRPGAALFLPVYRELFEALSPRTTVLVTVADSEDERLFEEARAAWFPEGGGPPVRYARTGRAITSWARDRLAVLGPGPDGGPLTVVAPPRPMTGPLERVHDWTVPWAIRRELGRDARIRSSEFQFEGGDLIADEGRVYVATPLFERNPDRSPEEVLRAVEALTGLPAVRIGDDAHPVPDHHIGMFLTPLGGGRVAWADPDLALAVLREAGALGEDGRLEVGGAPLTLDLDEARLERFRNVGRLLRRAGLTPVSLPVLPTTERYVLVSYDNALLERRDRRLHVYMPSYGLPALDAAARAVYEAEGALVHPVRVDGLFRLGGSVRCLTAPLRRLG